MENRNDMFAATSVGMLLLLTAWGNAKWMLVASGMGLIVGLVVLRRRSFRGALLVAMAGFAVAMAIAIVMTLSRGR